ncbi:hypothetical protein DFJ77DRAFT_271064 [Powellomyces hirtus]|nr:hypothetical protein DFJ77DRAFT_271064 [Powellomyces hirtus]
MTTKLTTFIVGPPRTGKTCISNHLAELSESLGGAGAGSAYHPTQGVRILEFDRAIPVNGKQVEVACEVWDCSGDSRFQASWPVLARSANAVIFVAGAETREREFDAWQGLFSNLSPSQMVVFSHSGSGNKGSSKFRASGPLSRVAVTATGAVENDANGLVRQEFDSLLSAAYTVAREANQKEEESLMS